MDNFWKDKKVFVTGGTGFIGNHLISALIENDCNVLELVHETPSSWDFTDKVYGSVLNPDAFYSTLKYFNPDIIFHLAAQPIVEIAGDSPEETIKVNSEGTANILAIARELNLKSFVHISTDKVYGYEECITEESILDGTDHPYNVSKHSADLFAQMYQEYYDLPITVIRHANVYGEGDRNYERIIPGTIKRLLNNESPVIRGDGSNLRDYLYVSDVIRGYLMVAERGWGKLVKPVLFGAEKPTSVREVIYKLIGIINPNIRPKYEDQFRGEIPNQHVEYSKWIGWKPEVSLDEGLKRTVDWYKKHGI